MQQQHTLSDDYYRCLLELQTVDFVLVELTLYLDTHPGDEQAVRQFNENAKRRAQLAYQFESKFGPLMQFGHSFSGFPWNWPQTPWPWQV
ncbi:spore coat protein CotJB [Paenibacillus contaminans]|uniref:Spore coat protein CotJB n=1 Tax=Paenibacillus contaminans TaxID=450362 RepID=A0A329MU74_9BACL|nr:spore coat protein CotJB [Paenibacillus contaminans]RAV22243.1 spore coat protein CotJB [Paenibacillus contaminans]